MTVAEKAEAVQHLIFKLDEEVFAIDISKIREVLKFTSVTKVPQTSEFMRGVINLRGSVVPVVDLRLKFGKSETAKTVNACVIIVELSLDGETAVLGVLADSVQEVFEFGSNQIEPSPKIGARLITDFIKGMGKRDEEFIIILDIDKVFSTVDLSMVQDVSNCAASENDAPYFLKEETSVFITEN